MRKKSETLTPSKTGSVNRGERGRWPLDVRLKVAHVVVEEKVAAREVAQRFGVPYTTVLQWADWYRRGGAQKPQMPVDARVRTPGAGTAAKRAAILATKKAEPAAGSRRIRDVMRRFLGMGTSATTVSRVLKAEGVLKPHPPMRARVKRKVVRFERAEPYRAMTGGRGMEQLLGSTVRNYLPPDWGELARVLGAASTTYGALSSELQRIVAQNAVLTDVELANLPAAQRARIELYERRDLRVASTSPQSIEDDESKWRGSVWSKRP